MVAPPGGAPGTPAGYCWLLDVSLRRMARSGWTCDLGDDHDDLRDVRTRTLVAVATFPSFPCLIFFFPRLEQKDGVPAAVPAPKRAGGRLGQIFVSASS